MNVPPGWKLVPIEPTPEMIEACFGRDGLRLAPKIARITVAHAIKHQRTSNEPGAITAWRAMVAAAPEPPQ